MRVFLLGYNTVGPGATHFNGFIFRLETIHNSGSDDNFVITTLNYLLDMFGSVECRTYARWCVVLPDYLSTHYACGRSSFSSVSFADPPPHTHLSSLSPTLANIYIYIRSVFAEAMAGTPGVSNEILPMKWIELELFVLSRDAAVRLVRIQLSRQRAARKSAAAAASLLPPSDDTEIEDAIALSLAAGGSGGGGGGSAEAAGPPLPPSVHSAEEQKGAIFAEVATMYLVAIRETRAYAVYVCFARVCVLQMLSHLPFVRCCECSQHLPPHLPLFEYTGICGGFGS